MTPARLLHATRRATIDENHQDPYPTKVEADLARIALDTAGVTSVVVGIGVGMEGGAAGVQLLVDDDRVELALKVLGDA